MPADVAGELKSLLLEELAELVRRDRRRLDPWLERVLNARCAANLVLLIAAAAMVVTTVVAEGQGQPPIEITPGEAVVLLWVILGSAAAIVVLMTLTLILRRRSRKIVNAACAKARARASRPRGGCRHHPAAPRRAAPHGRPPSSWSPEEA